MGRDYSNCWFFTATQGIISKEQVLEIERQRALGMRVIYKRNEEEYYPRFEIYIYQPDNLEHYAQVLI